MANWYFYNIQIGGNEEKKRRNKWVISNQLHFDLIYGEQFLFGSICVHLLPLKYVFVQEFRWSKRWLIVSRVKDHLKYFMIAYANYGQNVTNEKKKNIHTHIRPDYTWVNRYHGVSGQENYNSYENEFIA